MDGSHTLLAMRSFVHDDLVEMLRAMRRAETDVFGALDPAVRDEPIRPGDWSPKDRGARQILRGATRAPPFARNFTRARERPAHAG